MMIKRTIKFFMDWRGERAAHCVLFSVENEDGHFVAPLLTGLIKKSRHGLAETDDSTLYWDDEELRVVLQQIVNEAHQKLGIVPAGWDNEVKAQTRHLNDMRKIVFRKLDIKNED